MSERDEEKSRIQRDDLEYNDGLGDLLKEREQFEFSWLKTVASVLVIILALYVAVTVLFKLAKSMVENTETTSTETTTVVPLSHDALVDEILSTASATVVSPTPNTPSEVAPQPAQQAVPETKPVTMPTPTTKTPPAPTQPSAKPTSAKTSPTQAKNESAAEVIKYQLSHKTDTKNSQKTGHTKSVVTPEPAKSVSKSSPAVPISKHVQTQAVQTPPQLAEHVQLSRLTKRTVTKSSSTKLVETTKPSTKTGQPSSTGSGSYKVIAGSFISRGNADVLRAELAKKGITTFIWSTTDHNNETVYRVQVGSFKSKDVAQRLQSELNSKGVETYIQNN